MLWVFAVPGSPIRPRQFEFPEDSRVTVLENRIGIGFAAQVLFLAWVIADMLPEAVMPQLFQVHDHCSDNEIRVQGMMALAA